MVTGLDDAWEFAPPVLHTIATKLCVAAPGWLTVAELADRLMA